MIKEVRLPEISENVDSGDVTKVLVSVGDTVEVDQPLVELETEKAVFEVPSTAAGKITEILVGEGDTVEVGQTLVKIETGGEDEGEGDEAEPEKKEAGEEKDDDAGEEKEDEEKKDTGREEEDAAEEPESGQEEDAGKKAGKNGDKDAGDADEADEEDNGKDEKQTDSKEKKKPAPDEDADKKPESPPPASPSVRRLARELGVNIRKVSGSGRDGKISADDVKQYAKGVISTAADSGAGPAAPAPRELPDFSRWGEVERKPMSKVRRITAERMAEAWTTVPHVTQHDKADVTALEAARKKFGKRAEKAGGKLTMTAILLKVCAGALKNFSEFNTSLDAGAGELVYKKYVNIGVAVDTDRGLLVPVIRNVDCKSIVDLSVELTRVAESARNKKIKPDELEGGNFTVSNLGGIGGTSFTPIVYAPEVAILGVSRGEYRPQWNGEKFEPRLILPLSLSYDHRVIDGAQAARFVRWIAKALEDPMVLALES